MGDTSAPHMLDANGKVLHEAPALKKRMTYDVNGMVEYIGFAAPGTATSSALWQIRKFTNNASNGPTAEDFADGDARFNQIWDNRTSLSYS